MREGQRKGRREGEREGKKTNNKSLKRKELTISSNKISSKLPANKNRTQVHKTKRTGDVGMDQSIHT